MNIIELKAMAYDTLAQIEELQRKLHRINAEITKLSQEIPAEQPKE